MDDETFLDDEIYDDDASEHHPVDDLMDADARANALIPGDSDADSDADLDIATLGVEVASVDLAPSLSCFTPAHLSALAGCDVESLGTITSLEMRADAAEEDLSAVGELMPRLAQLRMNTSIVPTMRAFGSRFQSLRVLWIARAGVEDLSGAAALVRLTELYASFNDIKDVGPLAELDFLEVLDLEANRVEDEDAPDYLNACPALRELSLEGNPIAKRASYRRDVCVAVKRLRTLDDAPVTDADRAAPVSKNSAAGAEAPPAERFKELELVADGIKYAAVGIDDPDAVTTRDDATGELRVALADEALGGALGGAPGADADAHPRGGRSGEGTVEETENSSGPAPRERWRAPTPWARLSAARRGLARGEAPPPFSVLLRNALERCRARARRRRSGRGAPPGPSPRRNESAPARRAARERCRGRARLRAGLRRAAPRGRARRLARAPPRCRVPGRASARAPGARSARARARGRARRFPATGRRRPRSAGWTRCSGARTA